MSSGIVRKRWSPLEDEQLRNELEKDLSIETIASLHGRTVKSIRERRLLQERSKSDSSNGSDSEIFCNKEPSETLSVRENIQIATDKDIIEFLNQKILSGEIYFHVVDLVQIPYFASVWNLQSYDLYEYRFAALLKAVASEYRLSIRSLTRKPSLFEVYSQR
jgi:hypothetical protein